MLWGVTILGTALAAGTAVLMILARTYV
jgi:hypothetical protein